MEKGTVYYFAQAGIERSKGFLTRVEACREGQRLMQMHNPRITLRRAIKGVRGSTVVKEMIANCAVGSGLERGVANCNKPRS
jgi:hypothetical protein